jgi:hypothetical protein
VRALLFGTALVFALAVDAAAQREHTRPAPNRSTAVTEAQATELTLTLTEVAVRPIQLWVRTAGEVDTSGRVVSAAVPREAASRVRVGQRVRAFSPESRSRMYQATVADLANSRDMIVVKAALMGRALEASRYYVLEIVTEAGDLLSVPNEAIIESGGKQVVYVQGSGGTYEPREIGVGVRGELFTEVTKGLNPGEQVVTIGSFFIDAEHKLKGS